MKQNQCEMLETKLARKEMAMTVYHRLKRPRKRPKCRTLSSFEAEGYMYTIGRWERAPGGPAIRIPPKAVKELIIFFDTDVLDLVLPLHK